MISLNNYANSSNTTMDQLSRRLEQLGQLLLVGVGGRRGMGKVGLLGELGVGELSKFIGGIAVNGGESGDAHS